jgi:hypothetical protein
MVCPVTNDACRTNGCGPKCYKLHTLDSGYKANSLDLAILTASRIPIGDHSSVAEELLSGKSNLTSKVECAIKSTIEGYFSFQEALEAYSLTLEDFRSYFNEKY